MVKLKFIFLFIIILKVNYLFSQTINDTLFFSKKSGNNIYLEPDFKSKYYKLLFYFEKSSKTLNQNWLPVYLFKNKYYLYYSCDESFNQKISFNNQTIKFFAFETNTYNVNSITIKNKNIDLKFFKNKKQIQKLEILYLKKPANLALFKRYVNGQFIFQLMINVKKANKLPLIVNDCKLFKSKEFLFEAINFRKIIKDN